MSKIIRVLTRRVIPKPSFSDGKELVNSLTSQAINHKGFLKSSSFVEYSNINNQNYYTDEFDNYNLYTISEWYNFHYWDNWFLSDDRKKIINQYNKIIVSEDNSVMQRLKHDVFLL